MEESQVSLLFKALKFASYKHRNQTRKGEEVVAYINHPIHVAELLWETGKVRDLSTLIAAILHDTLEDTQTTHEEISTSFGPEVLSIVIEVTDDKSLPKHVRKQLQIEHAPHKSTAAKQIKLADKIDNVCDITHFPPQNWSIERRKEYLDWSEKVVEGLRGSNSNLEHFYDERLKEARKKLGEVQPVQVTSS